MMKIYKLDEFSDVTKRKGEEESSKEDKRSKLERIKDKELGVLAATVLCLKRGCNADGPEVVIGPAVFRLCENKRPCENRQTNLLDLTKGKEKGHGGPRNRFKSRGNERFLRMEEFSMSGGGHMGGAASIEVRRRPQQGPVPLGPMPCDLASEAAAPPLKARARRKSPEGTVRPNYRRYPPGTNGKPKGELDVTLTTKGGNSSVDVKKTEKRQTRKAPKGKKKESRSNGGISILSFAGDGAATQKGWAQIVQKKVDTLTQKAVVKDEKDKSRELIKTPVEDKKDVTVKEKPGKEKETVQSVVEDEKGRISPALQEVDRPKTAIEARDEPAVKPISPRQLVEPTKKALGIDEDVAEKLLNTALGYLAKYPSVGNLRFVDDISKLSKSSQDLVKKLLNVLKAYDVVEVHEMGVVNLIRPVVVEMKTSI